MVHLVAAIVSARSLSFVALIALVGLLGAGCGTDCRRSCQHVLDDCGVERPGYTVDNCEAECGLFLAHYEDRWEEENAKDSVACVRQAACEELRTGTPCYDPAVYIW